MAISSAPIPHCGKPSSTVTILPVLMTLLITVSRSIGFMVLRLITSQEIPYFARISAASNENLTFLEYPTIVTCFPYLIILALPIGKRNPFLTPNQKPQNFHHKDFSFPGT
jgi:hypothetical protein